LEAGGTRMTSHSFLLLSTAGQPAVSNELTSTNYRLTSGFWAGAWPWIHNYLPLVMRRW